MDQSGHSVPGSNPNALPSCTNISPYDALLVYL